jgi:hypothetical protein
MDNNKIHSTEDTWHVLIVWDHIICQVDGVEKSKYAVYFSSNTVFEFIACLKSSNFTCCNDIPA